MESGIEERELTNLKRRKYNLLIKQAMKLFEKGAFPTVTELATEAQVSRATAYRYFPTQSDLISAVVDESLKPIILWQPEQTRVEERVNELLSFAYPQMFKHEGALRAALLLSLQQWAEERASLFKSETDDTVDVSIKREKLVRGHRKQILKQVTAPLNDELPADLVEKVNHALSIIYGSEVFMVLKDIWQLENDDVQAVTKWIAKAILNQARADAEQVK
ncbi:TetR/AcrR family transcriptional regulator [Budviciaceae bacterium CWB-B4]|uniref:TetR/AcrR family transcriptional regulator n=1 Tax=Limnobaculum xujianqingii TaxID=2738837 RepID=A0A9D7FT00_9GAMM|nr:TetR/AcrR family transcriptional regulator [Limnobaculum xujianqingii]MBK5073049.1 TetR/AcrR family transcriptional regulator [Limnobaculum xujianqingii]MBK5176358.1 TetR/AcrR family transcriptional regulator [Limnobaculum xujianqingii]